LPLPEELSHSSSDFSSKFFSKKISWNGHPFSSLCLFWAQLNRSFNKVKHSRGRIFE
jgi:hypothetical protein